MKLQNFSLVGIVLLLLVPIPVSVGAAPGQEKELAGGQWGRQGVVLKIEDERASFQDVCFGTGWLPSPIPVDEDGRFDLAGGFRVLPSTGTEYAPARFIGQVSKDYLAITVISTGSAGAEFVRAYVLRRGGRIGRINDCGAQP